MELESRTASLQAELDSATPTSLSRRNQDPTSWLPRSPARHTLQSHRESVTCVAFHPVFSSLASGSADYTIKIWDVSTGYCGQTIRGDADWVRDVSPSFDGQWLLSAGNDQTARIWDASSGEPKATLLGHEHVIECCVFAPPAAYGHLATLAGLK